MRNGLSVKPRQGCDIGRGGHRAEHRPGEGVEEGTVTDVRHDETDQESGRRAAFREQAERIRAKHLAPDGQRPASSTRGVHHVALLSSDVERTVEFYQGVLEMPLTELFENRDYAGSSHFFFDIGHGNLLAFFDMPGLDLGPYAEVLGGLHHLCISVERDRWLHLRKKLDEAGVEYLEESDASLYFRDPDGARIELLSDPLGEMYGAKVL